MNPVVEKNDTLVFYADETKPSTAASDDRDTLHLTDEDKIENVPAGSFSSMRDLVLYPGKGRIHRRSASGELVGQKLLAIAQDAQREVSRVFDRG